MVHNEFRVVPDSQRQLITATPDSSRGLLVVDANATATSCLHELTLVCNGYTN